jgi:membrane fusion protein (multidrug efflux system)
VKSAVRYFAWTIALGAFLGLLAPKLLPLLSGSAQSAAASAATPSQRKGGGGVLAVSTYVVRPLPFAEKISSTGTLLAEESVELQAETSGKVVAINFTEGARVRNGDLLLKLNDAPMRAALVRATYRRELARLRETRLAKLLEQKVVTQNDYDTALSDVNVQEAEIALTQAQIAETEIRAPFDGIVGLRFVSIGAYVSAATRIATLQHLDRLKMDFSVPEKYATRIKPGSPVTFRVAGSDQMFDGQIYAVDPRIDSGTRTVLSRALCRNEAGVLRPGAFASVEITLSAVSDAVLIPAEAVIPGLEEKSVYVIADGHATRRVVQTGARTTSRVHVLAGLKPGDVVITSGLVQLRAGQAVTPLAEPKVVSMSSAP